MRIILALFIMLTGCVTAPCPAELGGPGESCSLVYIPVPSGDPIIDAAQAINLFYKYRQSVHEYDMINHN